MTGGMTGHNNWNSQGYVDALNGSIGSVYTAGAATDYIIDADKGSIGVVWSVPSA